MHSLVMTQMSKKGPLLIAGAALVANTAWAAASDFIAQLGLAPAKDGSPGVVADKKDPSYAGLKVPRGITGGLELDFLRQEEAGASMVYGGTRTLPGLGLSTSQFIGGMQYPLSANWSSTIETSVDTPSSGPGRGYGVVGQVHRSLPGGWDMSLGLGYRLLESGASSLAGGRLDSMSLPERSWSLYPPAAGTNATAGYEFRLNYRYGERNTLGVTYGAGTESDYTRQMLGMQPGEGRQFGLTGEHWLTPDWALNYGVMAQEQVGPHRGQGLRLGLRYRF